MKPVKLVMEGFETYLHKTEIDFEKFGGEGLFLICGDTGSGKTTIFDAITFALYGEASGNNRNNSMLRSNFASPDIPTEVSFTFDFQGKRYSIRRNPEYERKSKRGNSIVKEGADAELLFPDGKLVTQFKAVTEAVTELIGLDKKQFTKIAMLSQGDFYDLLFAGTDARIEIFRKIFNTDIYKEVQDKLNFDVNSLQTELKAKEASINQYVSGIVIPSESENFEKLEKLKNEKNLFSEKIEIIKSAVNTDKIEESELSEKIKTVEAKRNSLIEEISKLEETNKAVLELYNFQVDFELKKQKLAKADIEKSETQKLVNSMQLKQDEIVLLEKELSSYDELDLFQKELTDLNDVKNQLEKNVQLIQNTIAGQKNKIVELREESKSLSKSSEKLQKLYNEEEKGKSEKSKLEDLEIRCKTYNSSSEKLSLLQNQFKLLSEKHNQKMKEYNQKNQAFMNEQAGIIASSLVENEPCPVCGSLKHPNPAVCSAAVVSKSEVDSAKADFEAVTTEWNNKHEQTAELNSKVKLLKEDIEKQFLDLFNLEYSTESINLFEAKINQLKQEINSISENIAVEKNNVQRFEEIQKQLPEVEAAFEKNEMLLIDSNNQLLEKKSRIDEKNQNLERILSGLKFKSKDSAVNYINKIKIEIETAKNDAEKADAIYQEQLKTVTEIESKINLLKKQTADFNKNEFEELKNQKELLEQELSDEKSAYNSVISRKTNNQASLEKILEKEKEVLSLNERFSWLSILAKTANGMLGDGKEKLKLETYVQITYFDRVISRANTRFLKMSGGQYELRRRNEISDGRSQYGLDLDVYDHYTGLSRSVKSLSGGECFEASLSLALGLSDEIQSTAGGIQLDSMFVDEGFGTLSEEKLKDAVKILSDLTEGKRLVGIISHVSDLRDKIDRKILVTKEKSGSSSIKLVTD